MPYTITSDTVGLAIGAVSETANNVHEALSKARQMCETGLVNVSIKDQAGHRGLLARTKVTVCLGRPTNQLS
jgi:hypothetical protein